MNEFKVPKINKVKVGQIIEAQVVSVSKTELLLDVNDITEGTLYIDHFDKPAPNSFVGLVKVGDVLKVKVTKRSEGDDSSVILLTRLDFVKERTFDKLKQAYLEKEPVRTKVASVEPKGLRLDFEGVKLFLPYSLLDFELLNQKNDLLNQELEVMITEYKEVNKNNRLPSIIASRKPIFERVKQEAYEQRQKQRQDELDHIHTGDIIEGKVEKIEEHAAHIKFEHVMGLLRISQLSHYRVEKISDVLAIGQTVKVKVIKKEGNRLDLSLKALEKTPYEKFSDEHKVGQTVTGKVISKLPFGYILELDRDVKGLLHKSEFTWDPKDNFDAYVKINDEFQVAILSKDVKKERISLSKKAVEVNPWLDVNVKVGQEIEVRVAKASKDGLEVEYQGVDGFIPTSELAVERINPSDHFSYGDIISAMVTDFNKDEWILKLSIKRIILNKERIQFEQYLQEQQKDDYNVTIGDLLGDLGTNKKKKK